MKCFYRISVCVLAAALAVIVGVNWYLGHGLRTDSGRPWRVEINRLVLQLEQNGSADLSGCQYVTKITAYREDPEGFYSTDSENLMLKVNGEVYRFDYVPTRSANTRLIAAANVGLGCMAVLVLAVLAYIRRQILRPFETLTEVPFELSKGNLTVPVKESRNRFFGRFVWGVDLLREKMEQQKQRELELQKEKKTLLMSLSHDIKTPLSAIKLYASALSRGLYADTDRQLEIAQSINRNADEIEGYVAQILRASNEDFLRLQVEMGEFYLSELLDSVCGYYAEKLALIQTSFSVSPYANCLLRGDLDRGVEVVQNMMENAIKYGDGRQIVLEIDREDGCVLISVRNSGCTLPEGELAYIFDSFWRGSNAQKHKGSGLGLYICRQLMHKMGGEIFARIKDGEMAVTAVFAKA